MTSPPTQPRVYRFDGFSLDEASGTLRGPDRMEIVLRPKSFALLRHFLSHPGRLLARGELLDALWPGLAVTDDSLTQCVGDLRRGFGERATRMLRTVPRRGYMFIASVEDEAPEPVPVAVSSWPAAAPTRQRDSLLILPLEATGNDEAARRFVSILISGLTAELVHFEDLRIVSGGRTAGADGYELRGEAHSAGTSVHATLRLSHLPTSTSFWADRIDLPVAQVADLPVTTIVAIASAISVQIGRASLRHARRRPRDQLTARELCLLGRELHQHGTEADTTAARTFFVASAKADPAYSAARAWHAFTLMRIVTHGWGGMDHEDARNEAVRLAREAVEMDVDSSLNLSALAFALALRGRWDEAVSTARLAISEGRAADFGVRTACAEVLAAGGEPAEAADALRQTIALDPYCPPRTRAILGRALLLAGDPDAALDELRRCAARLPDYAPCFRTMVVAGYEADKIDEACMALREVMRVLPSWIPDHEPVFWFLRRPGDIERFETAFRATMRLEAAARHGRFIKPGLSRA